MLRDTSTPDTRSRRGSTYSNLPVTGQQGPPPEPHAGRNRRPDSALFGFECLTVRCARRHRIKPSIGELKNGHRRRQLPSKLVLSHSTVKPYAT